jgi:hypothetical protein
MILGRGEKLAAVLSAPGGFLGAVSRQVFSLCLGGVLRRRGEGQDEGQPRPANASVFFLPSQKKSVWVLGRGEKRAGVFCAESQDYDDKKN